MSWLTTDCKPSCWARVTCTTCGLVKAPIGRDAGIAADGMCTVDCDGWRKEPRPGHLWPSEAPTAEVTS